MLRRTVSGARSASRRYPRELWQSLRNGGGHGKWSQVTPATRDALSQLAQCKLGATWLGHATHLIRMNEELFLSDPVLSDRIGPRIGRFSIGLGRLSPAPAAPGDLPRFGTLLISHAHFDHLDRPTLAALASPDISVVTSAGTRQLIPVGFGRVIELDWGDSLDVGSARLTAIRPAHWGARRALDRARGYNSYLIESRSEKQRRILFGGDTAMTNAFDGLGLDLAIMGIGGYQPWLHAHANPEQVWEMVEKMRADRVLPMHHSTFPLSEEPMGEPLERLMTAAGRSCERIAALSPGQSLVQ
ncbi:MAG: MBL fold metallo-hydrolase [Phycisphaerales bacterium]|nr:MBL fold metallo-hydrolase [Phycisphaerales bacterium]